MCGRAFALALLLAGCDQRPQRAEERERAPSERADLREGASSGCQLGPVERWLETGSGSPALVMDASGGLALALRDGTLEARALSPEGRALAPARRAELAGARALLALVARGEGYLLVAHGSCEAGAHCLIAQALDREGSLLVQPVTVALPDPIRTSRRAGDGSLFFFAWSTTSGHRALERFAVAPGGAVSHERIALGEQPASAEHPVEILGLVADGERFATVWRRGVTEDSRSEVQLTSGGADLEETIDRGVHVLHDALAVDSSVLEGDTLALITTFEFSRPHLLRIDLASGEPRSAREVVRGEPLPAPLADRIRAELDVDGRGLWLRRRDAAGDPVGERLRVVGSRIEGAALARAGDSFFAIWMADGATQGRRVTCE